MKCGTAMESIAAHERGDATMARRRRRGEFMNISSAERRQHGVGKRNRRQRRRRALEILPGAPRQSSTGYMWRIVRRRALCVDFRYFWVPRKKKKQRWIQSFNIFRMLI